MQELNDAHEAEVTELNAAHEAVVAEKDGEISSLTDEVEKGKKLIDQLNESIDAFKKEVEQKAAKIAKMDGLLGNRNYQYDENGQLKYTVTRGDGLAEICAKCGIDYNKETVKKIIEMNGLKDENSITAGQVLILPAE